MQDFSLRYIFETALQLKKNISFDFVAIIMQ